MNNFDLVLTGPRGNLGSHILKKFKGSVCELGRSDWDHVMNSDLCAKTIVHCAFDLKNRYSENPEMMIESNLLSTARLLEFAKKNSIKKFIFISSSAVYGNNQNTAETGICSPITINGHIKMVNEHLIKEFCTAHGIKYHILRVFNLYGGDDHFSVVSHLLRSIKQHTPFKLNNQGKAFRDFIHVEDVCDVVLKIVDGDYLFPILNVGTGTPVSIYDLVEIAKRHCLEMKFEHSFLDEIHYSKADLSLFNQSFKMDFIKVVDFLERELCKKY